LGTKITIEGTGFDSPKVELRPESGSPVNISLLSESTSTKLIGAIQTELRPGIYSLVVTNKNKKQHVIDNYVKIE
jgi:hypothetical protein